MGDSQEKGAIEHVENRDIPLSTINNASSMETPRWSIKARFAWMQERVVVPVPSRAPTSRGRFQHELPRVHIRSEELTGTLNVVERIVADSSPDTKH
jgi:hypothetical protein